MNTTTPLHQQLDRARAAILAAEPLSALQLAQAAAERAAEEANAAARAEAQTLQVQNLFALGRFAEAHTQGQEAAARWLRLGQPGPACEVMAQMAIGWSEQGYQDEALALARRALSLVQAHGLDSGLPRVLSLMGGLHGRLGEWTEGEVLLMRALSLARDAHDAHQEVVTLNALLTHLLHACEALRTSDQPQAAAAASARLLQHARRALLLATEEAQPFRRVVLRSNAGAALLEAGLADEAAFLLAGVVEQAAAAGYRAARYRARLRLARAQLMQGHLDDAAATAQGLQEDLAGLGEAGGDRELNQLLQALAEARALTPGI